MKTSNTLLQKQLGDVAPQHAFWVHDGPILRNIYELKEELKNIKDDAYAYHVNKEKNDFANWVRDIIGDEKLSREISKSKNKNDAAKKVNAWIEKVEKKF